MHYICILALFTAIAPVQAKAELDEGWWIVLGTSLDPEYNAQFAHGTTAAAKRCGFTAYGDFSGKWTGFAPGHFVEVAGAYATRAEANRKLRQVRRCIPTAYLRFSSYAGD